MAILAKSLKSTGASICLTSVQRALLALRLPILDEAAVARHKRHAKLAMLWRSVRWPLVGISVLVAFQSLGGHWLRTGKVGAAGLLLGGLFTWLVSAADLKWCTSDYATYRSTNAVPENVAALADAVERAGVDPALIRVEFLQHDPILFVQEERSPYRYHLAIW
jgi:hypothetical protein